MLHEHPIARKWSIINPTWTQICRLVPSYITDNIRMGINFPVQSYGFNDRDYFTQALNIFYKIEESDA